MADLPLDQASRNRLRDDIRIQLRIEADQEARKRRRSLTCQWGQCEPCVAGPAGCLCPCHDPEEGQG